ncbi:tetratricopeptide repeat protein [Rhodococcoides fascians]|uniref:tetratricopeptide repeat protein n=1 Tax=Rhodococcoides fascians TaxID=1828 RepID=UPI00050C4A94|nr:tetratricopeptide repeat protein [Rhodococcus fascians]
MSDQFLFSGQSLEPQIRLLLQALSDYASRDDATGLLDEQGAHALETVELSLKGRELFASEDMADLLARVRLGRFQSLPAGRDRDDLKAGLKWFARVRRTNPSRVPESVRAALDESIYDEDWEEFGDPEWLSGDLLDAAIARLEELFEEAAEAEPDSKRRPLRGQVETAAPEPDGAIDPTVPRGSGRSDAEGPGEVSDAVRHAATLVGYLTTRFEQLDRRPDLDRAIGLGRWVLVPGRISGQPRLAATANLAGALMNLAEATSDLDALNEAVDLFDALAGERGTAADQSNLAVVLLFRFEMLARDLDLDQAVVAARAGARLTVAGDPFLPSRLSNLGSALRTLFDRHSDEEVLDEAVDVGREAVRLSDPEDLDIVRRLTNLAASLSTRFERHRHRSDIDESIDLGRRAVASGPATGHSGRVGNLASALHARGTFYGQLQDLQDALRMARTAAQAMPVGHSDRVDLLINAAGTAMSWFDWTGDRTAVLTSIGLGRTAAAEATDSIRNASVHSNLSVHLLTAFEAAGDIEFVHLAYREAGIGIRLAGERVSAVALSNLSLAARTLFEETGSRPHLDVALDTARKAVKRCPEDHPDRGAFLSNLGLCLYRDGQTEEAVEATLAAYEHPASIGTASGVAYAANAARMLVEQPGGRRDPRVMRLWEEVASSTTAPVPLRLEGLVTVARANVAHPVRSAGLYRAAVDLLPAAAWHGIDPVSRTRRLAVWQGLARDAGAMILNAESPAAAMAVLDGGLSQLWFRATPAASEVDRLRRVAPALADRVDATRRALTMTVP